MSFLVYQRSDPRYFRWLPLTTQQLRLRNLVSVIGINIIGSNSEPLFYTLHTSPMTPPFYTSIAVENDGKTIEWEDMQIGDCSVQLSLPGFIIRIWGANSNKNVLSWALYLNGLAHISFPFTPPEFKTNSIIFKMSFGYFSASDSLLGPSSISSQQRFLYIPVESDSVRPTYSIKALSSLHRTQRSILDELKLIVDLKRRICEYGYGDYSRFKTMSEKERKGREILRLKESLEEVKQRVGVLRDEKSRKINRIIQLKKEFYGIGNIRTDLLTNFQNLNRDKERLKALKLLVGEMKIKFSQLSLQLFRRKKELISELNIIYPISLVEGSKKYSINEVQLPNAEEYLNESGLQISVALGYTAHLAGMISYFLGIPLRYPIRHFGSNSRILDQITVHIPEREREFPLYYRSKEDVYSKYGVYLLNKNIAQLRWYCGLSTNELRATLPNIQNLLTDRLTIPGWPPNSSTSEEDGLEMGEELTEEMFKKMLNENRVSYERGLDEILPNEALEHKWLSCQDLNLIKKETEGRWRYHDNYLNSLKKYESEDIDACSLTNSLNLEFDAGRRLSSSSPVSTSSFIVEFGEKSKRKRRVGRVEKSGFDPSPFLVSELESSYDENREGSIEQIPSQEFYDGGLTTDSQSNKLEVHEKSELESSYDVKVPHGDIENVSVSSIENISSSNDNGSSSIENENISEDESLWLRTAALLNPLSLNHIRKRDSS